MSNLHFTSLQKHKKEKYFLWTSSNMGQWSYLIGLGKPNTSEPFSSGANLKLFLKRVYSFPFFLLVLSSAPPLWILCSSLLRSTQFWHVMPFITKRSLKISLFFFYSAIFSFRISSHRMSHSFSKVHISIILLDFSICKIYTFLLYSGYLNYNHSAQWLFQFLEKSFINTAFWWHSFL